MSRGRETASPWYWRFLLGLGSPTSLEPFLPSTFLGVEGSWCWEIPRERAQKAEQCWVPGDGGSGYR